MDGPALSVPYKKETDLKPCLRIRTILTAIGKMACLKRIKEDLCHEANVLIVILICGRIS